VSILPILALIIGDLVMPIASRAQILQSVQACDVVLGTNGFDQNALRSCGWRPHVINGITNSEDNKVEYYQTNPAIVTIETNAYGLEGETFYSCNSYARVGGKNLDKNKMIKSLIDHWFAKEAYKNPNNGPSYTYEEKGKLYTLRAIHLINGPAVQITVQWSAR
jgi:hypothetical protein